MINNLIKSFQVVDLSHTLEKSMSSPLNLPFGQIEWFSRICSEVRGNIIFMTEHHGTHVDAPLHETRLEISIDEMDPERFIGQFTVINMSHKLENEAVSMDDVISWEKENGIIEKNEIIVFCFSWDKNWKNKSYFKNHPGISEEAANYLITKQVKLVGTDTPDIDVAMVGRECLERGKAEPVHQTLLMEGVPILENLKNLDILPPQGGFMIALPLKIFGGSGSPVRAIALIPKDNKCVGPIDSTRQ